jgi:hypothetical protein
MLRLGTEWTVKRNGSLQMGKEATLTHRIR